MDSEVYNVWLIDWLIDWVPWTPGDWVVKSELFPYSGFVDLREVEPFHKNGP